MTGPARMSGVVLTAHGGPEVLRWRDDLPVPRPGPGEALVRVAAAGVNATDINTRLGWYSAQVSAGLDSEQAGQDGGYAGAIAFPRIQGSDLCGHVVALGEDADDGPPVGARVICPVNQPEGPAPGYRSLGSDFDGAFAQFCRVPVRHLHDVTASPLTDTELGAMPCAFGTAMALLDRAGVAAGQRVLVAGASGGVGLAAVQLAALAGARVTALASPAKAGAVLAAGAAEVLPRDAAPGPGHDALIEMVGGPGLQSRLDALRPGGRCAIAGAIAGPVVSLDLRRLYLRDIALSGTTFQPAHTFAALVSLINAGRIRPLVSATYPLSEIARAQEAFLSHRLPGKIVLIPPETLQ
jgi:NADPH:quinone reductase-like Zn-dependent oxidoreductase